LFMIDHITSATTGNTHPLPDSLPICERNDCRALFIRLTGKTDGANLIAPVIIHKKRIFFAEIDQLIHLISLWAIDPESIRAQLLDRKSTRLYSSHVKISYADFCLKKK